MFRTLIALSFLFLTASAFAQAASFPQIELTAGIHRIEAEVAVNQPQRSLGLMHRRSMPVNHGMLFTFPESAGHCFWMKNTLLPLSIAFLDERGEIINIAEMTPQSEKNHCPVRPARYALEMNTGWFKARGIAAGVVIGGIDKAPPAH
jgi:uncharacterized protein